MVTILGAIRRQGFAVVPIGRETKSALAPALLSWAAGSCA
jgi:hypothetical protein